jgi:hypothetical protein
MNTNKINVTHAANGTGRRSAGDRRPPAPTWRRPNLSIHAPRNTYAYMVLDLVRRATFLYVTANSLIGDSKSSVIFGRSLVWFSSRRTLCWWGSSVTFPCPSQICLGRIDSAGLSCSSFTNSPTIWSYKTDEIENGPHITQAPSLTSNARMLMSG